MPWAAVVLLAVCAFAQEGAPGEPKYMPPAPEQPIPYSHRVHIKAGLQCKSCHPMPDTGEFATIPETALCMGCHTTVKAESPSIRKLADFHKEGTVIPWRRIYRIPEYVFFSHREHVAKGAACQTCHGPVQDRDVMRKERDISMAACMECHRARQASLACNYCHNQR